MTRRARRTGTFIVTREHRRFVEFANAVRRNATIGLCHGRAGVGKTLSARRYAHWDLIEPLVTQWGPRDPSDAKVYAAAARARTLFYTPPVGGTIAALRKDICSGLRLSGVGREIIAILGSDYRATVGCFGSD